MRILVDECVDPRVKRLLAVEQVRPGEVQHLRSEPRNRTTE